MTTIKNTHTIPDVEKLIAEKLEILKNGETDELKRKARKEVLKLEKHLRDVDDKLINGKKYPERIYHHDDKPMNKKEVLKLIDSVDCPVVNGDYGYLLIWLMVIVVPAEAFPEVLCWILK